MDTPKIEKLINLIKDRCDSPLSFTVSTNSGANKAVYKGLCLIHDCCSVNDFDGKKEIRLVARGANNGIGPFVFLWSPEISDPDWPACNGMPLVDYEE